MSRPRPRVARKSLQLRLLSSSATHPLARIWPQSARSGQTGAGRMSTGGGASIVPGTVACPSSAGGGPGLEPAPVLRPYARTSAAAASLPKGSHPAPPRAALECSHGRVEPHAVIWNQLTSNL